jgi:hypothetical protein
MPDLTAYATAGLFTESGQADLTAFASSGVLSGIYVIVISDGRELIALHRLRWMIPEERNLEIAELRVLKLSMGARKSDMAAASRLLTLHAVERKTELYADEEITW